MDNFALRPKLFIGTSNGTSCIIMSQSKLTNKNMSLNLMHLSCGKMLMDQRPKFFIQITQFSTSPNLNLNMNILMFETIPTFSKDVFFSNLGIAPNQSLPL